MSEAIEDLNNFQRLGLKLASQRVAAELTVEQLAQLLRVMPKVVTAIEAGDETQLPKRVFILGYIHSYIRALELDEGSFADELAEVFPKPAEMSVAQRVDGGVDKSEVFSDQAGMSVWMKGLIAVSVVWVIAAVLAYLYLRPANTPLASVQDTRTTEMTSEAAVLEAETNALSATVDEPSLAADDSLASQDSTVEALVTETELVLAEETSALDVRGANSGQQSSNSDDADLVLTPPAVANDDITVAGISADEVSVDEVSVAEVIRETVIGDSGQRLELSFNAECWVEIKREDGSLVVGDLFNPSRRLIVNTDERVSVLLGYGPAANVMFAGKTVEFRVRDNAAAFFYVGE
jgi:cytoskeleton protein RodZ